MKVKNESEVTHSCPTLRDPMDCSLRGLSVHGIFQARVLECIAIAFSTDYCEDNINEVAPSRKGPHASNLSLLPLKCL